MTTIGATGYNSAMVKSLVSMRTSLNTLNTQLTSGLKAQTYGGLGSQRSLALSLTTKVARLENYSATIDTLSVRLNAMYTTLDRMNKLTSDVGGDMDSNTYDVLTDGKTIQQKVAGNALDEMVDLLNTDIAGSYVYGGRKTDQAPVVSVDMMMNGSGAKAGYKTVMAQRLAADQGSGTGRLTNTVATDTVTLAEDGAHPFGFKLTEVSSTLSNATVTGPTGMPASVAVQFNGQPLAGETMIFKVTLPDGTSKDIKLTAGDTTDPAAGMFAVGSTPDEAAANLQQALQGQLEQTSKRELVAASAFEAAKNFFSTFNGKAPQRVDGPPYDTATGLIDGTASDTVMWYQGDNEENATVGWSPRTDVTTRVDSSLAVQYGVRGNEKAFAEAMGRYAAISAIDISANDDDSQAVHAAVMQRGKAGLADPVDEIQTVELEIVHAQSSVKTAQERHDTLIASYGTTLDDIKNSNDTEVAVRIQALQIRMEASYAATSILYKLSLTNYL